MKNYFEINSPRSPTSFLSYHQNISFFELIMRPMGFGFRFCNTDGGTDVAIFFPEGGANAHLGPSLVTDGAGRTRTQAGIRNSLRCVDASVVELKLLVPVVRRSISTGSLFYKYHANFGPGVTSTSFDEALMFEPFVDRLHCARPLFTPNANPEIRPTVNRQNAYPDVIFVNCVLPRYVIVAPMYAFLANGMATPEMPVMFNGMPVPGTGHRDNGLGRSPNGNYAPTGPAPMGPGQVRRQPVQRRLRGWFAGHLPPGNHVGWSGRYVPVANVTVELQSGGSPMPGLNLFLRDRFEWTDQAVAWPVVTAYQTGDWAREFVLELLDSAFNPGVVKARQARDVACIGLVAGWEIIRR